MLSLLVAAAFSCLVSLSLGLLPGDNPANGACLCANSGVNVRSTACTNGNIIGLLSKKTCVQYRGAKTTACGYTWFKVRFNGVDGWVAGPYLNSASSSYCSLPGLTQKCLDCICQVEGCKKGCHFDVYSESCGYFQIKSGYYGDCGAPGTGWKSCADDKACATQCLINYLRRYGTTCTGGNTPTCQDYAKIHNGGPNGCKGGNAYWNKVQACLNAAG